MKTWMIGAVVVALVGASFPDDADARRFGGGKSSGMQRSMPERTAPPPAAPAPRQAQPGTPAQPGAATPAAAGAAAAPAAAAGRSWMGPIAGLAAGLGIAALLSHMGLGGAFAEFLMLALLLVVGFVAIRFVMRRMGMGSAAPATAAATPRQLSEVSRQDPVHPVRTDPALQRSPFKPEPARPAQPASLPATATTAATTATAASVAAPPLTDPVLPGDPAVVAPANEAPAAPVRSVPAAHVPSDFDAEGFARIAKAIFIRLQAANDSGDLDDIRRFTTPEMFAEIRLDLQDRGGQTQLTDVVKVEAQVLDVANEDGRQVVSVRYRGEVVETVGAAAETFDEVWHLVKPLDDSRSWAIAGIEQTA